MVAELSVVREGGVTLLLTSVLSHLEELHHTMKLKVYRTLWGVLQETDGDKAGSPVLGLEEAMAEIGRLGYDGVELPLKCILHLGKDRSGLDLEV